MDIKHFYKNKKNINIANDIIVSHINLMKNIDIYHLPYSSISEEDFFRIEKQILSLYPDINLKSKLSYREFILSRWLYKNIIEKNALYNKESIYIVKNPDGSINLDDSKILVSLSHKKGDILIGIVKKTEYLGLGVDIESYIEKTYIVDKILNEKEVINFKSYINDSNLLVEGIDEKVVLAIYFSTKESIYKALYPIVKTYFSFKDVEILNIDFLSGKINSRLNIKLDSIPCSIESSFSIIKDFNKVISVSYL